MSAHDLDYSDLDSSILFMDSLSLYIWILKTRIISEILFSIATALIVRG